MTDTTDKLIIQSETRGVQQTTSEVQGLSKAMDGVTVASQNVEKSTTSVEGKFAALERRLGTSAAQARQFEKDQKTINAAVAQNPEFASRAADAQAALAARYVNATKASEEFAKSTGLARHELINLSRQAQDVVVSLQGGQGFGTVFLQQGSQILDVLGTSQGGIRGSLASLGTSLRSLVTVGRVAFGAIAAGATGAAFATSDYLSQQKSLERSLIGAGRRSGSSADINRIADERSSLGGLSVSETREAAVEFAKTGQIHSRVIGEMIATTKNFALVTGQSSKEAAQALAGAFTNIQGIDQLNKQFNFLDASTRRTIENLLLAGRTTDAAAVANGALATALKDVEATQGGLEKGWTAIANAASNASSKVGEYIARASGLQGKTKLDRASEIASEIEGRQAQIDSGTFSNVLGDTTNMERARAKIEELRATLRELNREISAADKQAAFNALTTGAARAVAAIDPLRASLDLVIGRLTLLRDAQAQGINVPGLQMAVTLNEQLAQQLQNQMQAQDALATKYPGMTSEFAKQVEALKDQNALLKARENGNEATVAAAIAYKNAIAAGATETEAAAIRAETLKNNLLQAASAAGNMATNIQLGAVTGGEWMSAAEAESAAKADYKNPFAPDEMTQSGWFSTDPLKSLQASNIFGGAFGFETGASRVNSNWLNAMKNAEAQFLGGSGLKEDKIRGLQMQISALQPTLIDHPENRWQIRSLQRSMEELMNSVDENTSALDKVTLNPLYNGRDALKVGYMHAARGLDVIAQGPTSGDQIPFHAMVNGGERITITPAGQAGNDNSRSVVQHNTFNITGSQSTSRRSSRQLGQRYGQMMAALS